MGELSRRERRREVGGMAYSSVDRIALDQNDCLAYANGWLHIQHLRYYQKRVQTSIASNNGRNTKPTTKYLRHTYLPQVSPVSSESPPVGDGLARKQAIAIQKLQGEIDQQHAGGSRPFRMVHTLRVGATIGRATYTTNPRQLSQAIICDAVVSLLSVPVV